MRVLVTGGAGFIGSHLVEAHLARGDEVAVLDNFDSFYARARKEANLARARVLKGFTALHESDIRDSKAVRAALEASRPDAVIHLAALAGVRPSLEAPERYADVNLTGTMVLLEESVRVGVERFLFASSSSVYGAKPRGPFHEEAEADRPLSPYGATKRGGELLCHALHHTTSLGVTCVRIFTAFGPRQRPDLAIHKFARLMLERKPVPVFGDGSAERDFIYVSDIVDGLLRAVDLADGFHVYNLGRGAPVTVNETIEVLERALDVVAEREHLPLQVGDAPRTWASIERAKRELGYEPRVGYEEGIRRFVRWLREDAECASS